mmetsp:Transcript_41165/g.117433  ORF Transcript_41165/g.117433 Transcript_41165/m.117433 type:complete len:222 (+) Transcript_41165:124-789(+)
MRSLLGGIRGSGDHQIQPARRELAICLRRLGDPCLHGRDAAERLPVPAVSGLERGLRGPPRRLLGGLLADTPEHLPRDLLDRLPGRLLGRLPSRFPGGLFQGLRGSLPGGLPGGLPSDLPGNPPGGLAGSSHRLLHERGRADLLAAPPRPLRGPVLLLGHPGLREVALGRHVDLHLTRLLRPRRGTELRDLLLEVPDTRNEALQRLDVPVGEGLRECHGAP